jgi:hypothetical protein
MTMTMTQDDAPHDRNGIIPIPFNIPPNNPPIELPTFPVISPPIGEIRSPAPTPPAVHAAIGFLCLDIQPNTPDVFEALSPTSAALFAAFPAFFEALAPALTTLFTPTLKFAGITEYLVLVLYNVFYFVRVVKYHKTQRVDRWVFLVFFVCFFFFDD